MRKYFEVINTVTWFDDDYENETLVLTPGQIVEIELDDVPNFYPCLVLDNDMLDIAFDTWEEFYEFFKEVNLKEGEAIEFIDRKINVHKNDKTPDVVEMKLNTGEYIIVLVGAYNSDKKPASPDNIDFWRVSTKSIINEFKDVENDESITWPESEYIENKVDYSKVVELEFDVYLTLCDEEMWKGLEN